MDVRFTEYDLNKQMIEKESPFNEKEIENAKQNCENFLIKKYYMNNKYFMLLNNEKHDYTVFSIIHHFNPKEITNDIFECISNRGKLKGFVDTEDCEAIEIWIDSFAYYLFPYERGVIEY